MRRILIAAVVSLQLASPAFAASERRTVVISDTHFGIGRDGAKWLRREDFRWTAEWRAFLQQLREASMPTDLILAGDTFELWQSTRRDCRSRHKKLGCTEKEALRRLRHVIAAHRDELTALRDFANHGRHRVIIVPGNHDAALLYPAVAAELLQEIGADPDRVVICDKGLWQSPDDLILVAHGHQMDHANSFAGWPRPFRKDARGVVRLERPWGEQFVQSFYDALENEYEIIDNIATEADAVRLGIAAAGIRGTAYQMGRLATFLLMHTTLSDSKSVLGEEPKEADVSEDWDLDAVRAQGDAFFIDSVSMSDPARDEIARAVRKGTFKGALAALSKEELIELCDERAALHARDSGFVRCPTKIAREMLEVRTRGRMRLLRKYITGLDEALQTRYQILVLAHTHQPEHPTPVETDERSVQVVNTGAWQRVISAPSLEDHRRTTGMERKQVLRKVTLDRLTGCYPFVVIEPYSEQPTAFLRYWTGDSEQADCETAVRP